MFRSQLVSIFFILSFALSPVYGDFDQMQLVLTWPPTYCHEKSCARIPTNFRIHGLWPDNQHELLNNCKKSFTTITNSSKSNALDDRWPDLKYSKMKTIQTQDFWKYQYNKHGTCCIELYSQEAYFDLAMKLKDKFDLLQMLKSQGVIPGKTYTVNKIEEAIREVTQAYPNLNCIGDPLKTMELKEIGICFNREATEVVACHRRETCNPLNKNKISFPL
ncbi:ribonuclease S-7-like [Nicotiana tabacum]|uniref:Ribonuclease S-7-like n=1 Tax=Nicotiana tabacum TaxID=4097 RepID=A0A1S4BFD6_TOBAC|nr:PREDICTED: ribonuclease S-7-like [Nicotiana tabacum]